MSGPSKDPATRRWQLVREIFEQVVELPEEQRARALDQACAADPSLRAEVLDLLAVDSAEAPETDFLDTPPAQALVAGLGQASLVGEIIDGYAVQRLLGSGGMGAVYEATQDHPRRRVALKVMGHGLLDDAALRRFRYESEILGRLQHPGIAQVYAAGTHRLGSQAVPYFAMELVEDGRELCSHSEAEQLDLAARLRLMIEVCEAVQYGHQRGVIHRDLKPANILVDSQGHAKIIDFGIARCTDADFAGLSMQTQTGLLLGTLQFMSPEQVRGQRGAVDTRCDVYALGVILYQLLTGQLPHDLSDCSLPEAGRIICEEDPPPPEQLDRRLRGDLATILGTAMARDPGQRYASAGDLQRDLQNFLGNLPITARPPSTLYQVRKFARRHTALLATGLVFLLMLVAGLVAVSLQNFRIQEESARTQIERDKAELLVRYLRDVLSSAEAIAGKGPDYTVREALDAAAVRLGPELAGQPEVEAEIREVIGVTYMRLSLFDQAAVHLERAERLGAALGGAIQQRSRLALARLRMHQDRLDEALRLARAALQTAGELRRQAQLDLARYLSLDQRFAAAEAQLQQVLDSLDEDHPELPRIRYALGRLHADAADHQAATAILEPLLALEQGDEMLRLRIRSAWGSVLRQRGQLDSALQTLRAAHTGLQRRLGPEHRDTLDAAFELCWVRVMRGEMRATWKFAEQTLRGCHRVLGARHQHTRRLQRMVGGIRMQAGKLKEGAELFRHAYATALADKGPGHFETLQVGSDLAFAQYQLGEADAAMKLCEQILAEVAGKDSKFAAQCLMIQGLLHLGARRFQAAEQALADSLGRYEKHRGPVSYEVRGVLNCQLQLYQQWSKPSAAQRVQARIRQIDAARRAPAAEASGPRRDK